MLITRTARFSVSLSASLFLSPLLSPSFFSPSSLFSLSCLSWRNHRNGVNEWEPVRADDSAHNSPDWLIWTEALQVKEGLNLLLLLFHLLLLFLLLFLLFSEMKQEIICVCLSVCVCVWVSLVLVRVVAVVDVEQPPHSETQQNKHVEEHRNFSGGEPSGCGFHLGSASMSCRTMVGGVGGGVWTVGAILAMWASQFLLAKSSGGGWTPGLLPALL